jgi:hypothetical protein
LPPRNFHIEKQHRQKIEAATRSVDKRVRKDSSSAVHLSDMLPAMKEVESAVRLQVSKPIHEHMRRHFAAGKWGI